jgi:SAM-dependent methyltransferase
MHEFRHPNRYAEVGMARQGLKRLRVRARLVGVPPPQFLVRRLAPQFALPSGWMGRLVGKFMNRNNRRMNAFTIDALTLRPTDRVLEIGFGGGLNLAPLVERVPEGHVVGIEPSEAMLEAARKVHAARIATGRLRVEQGAAERLPLTDGAFDAACTVNTIYFWKNAEAGAREIHRVLGAGGRLAVTLLPGDRMELLGFPREVFRFWSPQDVESLLRGAGFDSVRVEQPPDPSIKWRCVVASKASS